MLATLAIWTVLATSAPVSYPVADRVQVIVAGDHTAEQVADWIGGEWIERRGEPVLRLKPETERAWLAEEREWLRQDLESYLARHQGQAWEVNPSALRQAAEDYIHVLTVPGSGTRESATQSLQDHLPATWFTTMLIDSNLDAMVRYAEPWKVSSLASDRLNAPALTVSRKAVTALERDSRAALTALRTLTDDVLPYIGALLSRNEDTGTPSVVEANVNWRPGRDSGLVVLIFDQEGRESSAHVANFPFRPREPEPQLPDLPALESLTATLPADLATWIQSAPRRPRTADESIRNLAGACPFRVIPLVWPERAYRPEEFPEDLRRE